MARAGACRKKKVYKCGGRKRKYLCARKRKATTKRCACKRTSKVTLCNRNWRRLSVKPFINFLREFRKGKQDWPVSCLVKKAKAQWCRMSKGEKKKYILQACRAKKRGYRT